MTELETRIGLDRNWLSIQPQFDAGWQEGCRWIIQKMSSWLESESKSLGLSLESRASERLMLRLWDAWCYHWRAASRNSPESRADGDGVIENLRRGIRPADPETRMRGDILRDVFLVGATLEFDPVAQARFIDAYEFIFERVAHRLPAIVEPDRSSLETDLLDSLLTRRLALYKGESSLKTWLFVVIRNFLNYRARRLVRFRSLETVDSGALGSFNSEPSHVVATRERQENSQHTLAVLPRLISRAFQAITVEDPRGAQILHLALRMNWPNGVIAKELGVHSGQASRLRKKALQRFLYHFKIVWNSLEQPLPWPGDWDSPGLAGRLLRNFDEIRRMAQM